MRVLICRAGHDGYSVTPETLRALAERKENDVVVGEYASIRGRFTISNVYIVVNDPKLASKVETILQGLQFKRLTDPDCSFVKWGLAAFQGSWFSQAVAGTFCGASAEIVYYEGEERQAEAS